MFIGKKKNDVARPQKKQPFSEYPGGPPEPRPPFKPPTPPPKPFNIAAVAGDFCKKVHRNIELERVDVDQFVVYVPFQFDDGDHYVIMLIQEAGNWVLTDGGHTLMHPGYNNLDHNELEDIVAIYGVENRSGELRIVVLDEKFGDALLTMIQVLNSIICMAATTKTICKKEKLFL